MGLPIELAAFFVGGNGVKGNKWSTKGNKQTSKGNKPSPNNNKTAGRITTPSCCSIIHLFFIIDKNITSF